MSPSSSPGSNPSLGGFRKGRGRELETTREGGGRWSSRAAKFPLPLLTPACHAGYSNPGFDVSLYRLSNDDGDGNENGQNINRFKACLHGGGGPQIGEVTFIWTGR